MIDYTLDQVREAVRETEQHIAAMSCGSCLVSVTVLHHDKGAIMATTDYSKYTGTGFCIVRRRLTCRQEDLSPLLFRLAVAFDAKFSDGMSPVLVTREEALAFIDEFEAREATHGVHSGGQ